MKARSENLTKREREVVALLLQGKSNKQIASALGISESTVEFHLRNVYSKLRVSSRAETILKLGKSTGLIGENPGESIVEHKTEIGHTGGTFPLRKQWLLLIRETVSAIKKEIGMKNRLFSYFLSGLIFGLLFWFYFGAIGRLMNQLTIEEGHALIVWAFLSIELLLIFGVWLLPTLLPMRYEFGHSKSIRLSLVAVITTWVSAVFGYYLTYLVLLAFIGLPNMEDYLLFGQHSPTFWQDWAVLFSGLILSKFLRWTVVSILVGGLAGFLSSSLYAFWVKKTNTILPA